jgi:hypothetical protein
MKWIVAVSVALVLTLSACAQSPTASKSDVGVLEKAAATQPQKSVVEPLPKNPSPPPVVATKPREMLEPSVLVGRTDAEIKRAFGDPNLRRKDSPAEVWQYLAQQCALHLFFYPGKSGEALIVRHIAINGRSVDSFSDLDRKQCFNDHLRAVGAEDVFIAKKPS